MPDTMECFDDLDDVQCDDMDFEMEGFEPDRDEEEYPDHADDFPW